MMNTFSGILIRIFIYSNGYSFVTIGKTVSHANEEKCNNEFVMFDCTGFRIIGLE